MKSNEFLASVDVFVKTAGTILKWLLMMTIICLFQAPSQARADVVDESEELYKYVTVVEFGVGFATLPFVLVNIDRAIAGKRPSAIWRWGGWITGAIYLGGGIAWFMLDERANCGNTCWVAGIAHFAYAALDIGITTWASCNPKEGEQAQNRPSSVTVGPLVMPDAEGNPAIGVGLRVVDW